MVDKTGMMRLRKIKQKKREEAALQTVSIYFDKLIDFVTDKIVNNNCVLVCGDEKSLKEFSAIFVMEPLVFEYKSLKYGNDENPFYFLKKDDLFRRSIDLAGINDKDFGTIEADKLVFMLLLYDNLTDCVAMKNSHVEGESIEEVRSIIKNVFKFSENLMEKFKSNQKLKLMREIMVKEIANSTAS